MADFEIEKYFFDRGYRFIAGVDEVGRGALCGPVIAAAVVWPPSLIEEFGDKKSGQQTVCGPRWFEQIKDSKLLTAKKRRELSRFILSEAESVGVGLCTNKEIDQKNIFWASLEAMRRAVERMPCRPEVVLVDGFELRGIPYVQQAIRGGDQKSYSIAAASIVAKVLRDRIMDLCDGIFSGYALGKNKGYGTREHFQALEKLGPASFHRKTFRLQLEKKLF